VTGIATHDIQNAWAWKDEVEEDKPNGDAGEIAADDSKTQAPLPNGDREKTGSTVDTDADAHDESDKPDASDAGSKKKRSKKKKA
jgi:hypothetical protein